MDRIRECASQNPDSKICILFIGGEPMMAFDEIKQIVEQCDAEFADRNFEYKMVSNGTLIHGEAQEWILKHQHHFHVTLSIDGDRETHNLNRCNSFDKIDFEFFTKRYKGKKEISMVTTPETIHSLADNIILWEKEQFYIKCMLADGIAWEPERDIPLLEEQLMRLIEYYLSHPEQYPTTMLATSIYAMKTARADQRCMVGKTSITILPNGELVPCYRGTPYYGDMDGSIMKALKSGKRQFATDECPICIARDICNACPAQAAQLHQNAHNGHVYCRMQRVLYKATAYLQLQMLLNGGEYAYLRNKSGEERVQIIENAQLILNTFA